MTDQFLSHLNGEHVINMKDILENKHCEIFTESMIFELRNYKLTEEIPNEQFYSELCLAVLNSINLSKVDQSSIHSVLNHHLRKYKKVFQWTSRFINLDDKIECIFSIYEYCQFQKMFHRYSS